MISLLRGTSIVAGLTLVSRVLGFVRDLLVASLLGAGAYSDAYLVAFRIPNMLRSLFAEGALTSAFVPTFSQALEQGAGHARVAFRSVGKFLFIVTGVVTLFGILFAPQIIDLVAPGFKGTAADGHAQQAVLLLRVMFPYVLAVSLVALINGALNSVGVFGASAYAQIVMNLCLIGGAVVAALFSSVETGLLVLAVSVVIGGAVQVGVQIPALRRAGLWGEASGIESAGIDSGLWSSAVKSTVRLMGPAIVGSAVYQLSVFLMTALSSLVSPGAVSWLYYSDRLIQLPIGVFSVALSSVLLPALSRAHAQDDQQQFEGKLSSSLRFSTFLIVPVSLLIWEYSTTLVWLLFERGEFNRLDTESTGQVVRAMALGIWVTTCQSLLARAFISRKDTVTPTVAGAISLVGTLLFAVMLMGPVVGGADSAQSVGPRGGDQGGWIITMIQQLQLWLPCTNYGAAGLALGNTLALMVGTLLLLFVLPLRVEGLSWRGFIRSAAQCWLAGGVAIWISRLAADFVLLNGGAADDLVGNSSPTIIGALVGSFAFVITYLGCLRLLRNIELKETWAVIHRLIKR